MTQEEFDNTAFKKGMRFISNRGDEHEILAVDWSDRDVMGDDWLWYSFYEITLINQNDPICEE